MSLLFYGFGLFAGWLVGGLANWAADHLPAVGKEQSVDLSLSSLPRYWRVAPDLPRRGRAVWLTVSMMAAFALIAGLLPDAGPLLAVAWLYVAFLLTVLVIDLEHRRVLNVMLGPAALVVLALSLLPGTPSLLSALLGGGAGFASFLLIAILGRGALGFGDVKLAGVIGLMTGYPAVIPALVLGIVLAGVAAIVLLVSRRATRKSYMAYAPYMAVGAILVIVVSFNFR